MNIKILVIGSGAVGSFYGGILNRLDNCNVSVLCRSDYSHIRQYGIDIKSPWGDFHFQPEHVLQEGEGKHLSFDYLLISHKVLPDIDLTGLYSPYLKKETALFLLQNGIGIEKKVQELFSENEIISGLAFTCINRIKPGLIHHIDYGHINIGSYPHGKTKSSKRLAGLFQKTKVPCELSEDILFSRWKKLVWNAPFNPISVLSGGMNTREILKDPVSRQLVREIMEEVCLIAEKEGHRQANELIDNYLDMTLKMEPYKTSMLLDYESNREMEVEAILGNLLDIARQHNQKLPHSFSLYTLLRALNKKNIAN